MKQAATQIMPAHTAWLILAGDGQLGGWVRRTKAQRPVRAVLVVVLEAVLRWDKAWHAEAVTSALD